VRFENLDILDRRFKKPSGPVPH